MKISDGGKLNLTKRTMVVAALAAGLIVAGAIAIVKPHASSTYVAQLTGTHKTPQAPKLPDSGVSSTPHGPLDLKGSGAEDTKQFTAGADWDLDWSYDCSKVQGQGVGRFAVSVFDSQGRVSTDTPPVIQVGAKGSGLQHYYKAGAHFLEIRSQCTWHVVTGPGSKLTPSPTPSSTP